MSRPRSPPSNQPCNQSCSQPCHSPHQLQPQSPTWRKSFQTQHSALKQNNSSKAGNAPAMTKKKRATTLRTKRRDLGPSAHAWSIGTLGNTLAMLLFVVVGSLLVFLSIAGYEIDIYLCSLTDVYLICTSPCWMTFLLACSCRPAFHLTV